MRIILAPIVLAAMLAACAPDQPPQPSQTPAPSSDVASTPGEAPAPVAASVHVFTPGEAFAGITRDTDEAELATLFGADNLQHTTIPGAEGLEEFAGTRVFPDTDREFVVLWREPERRSAASIEVKGSAWRTPEGLHIGMPLVELVRANGRDFRFHGFDWDGSGLVATWDGGVLERYRNALVVRMKRDSTNLAPAEASGDQQVPSSLPALSGMDVRIGELAVAL